MYSCKSILALVPLVSLFAVSAADAQTYTVTDLSSLTGYPMSSGYALNSSGEVALTSSNTGNYFRAFTNTVNGTPQALSTASGMSSFAEAISNNGTVLGYTMYSSGSGSANITEWNSQGIAQTIGQGIGYGINDSGEVVGSGSGGAFVYTPATGMRNIGTFDGSNTESNAYAVNNTGQVVGYSETATSPSHAFIWTPSVGFTNLGTLKGDVASAAYALNSTGEVVGYSAPGGLAPAGSEEHAFSWTTSGGMVDLGALTSNDVSIARGINDEGEIVGNSVGGTSLGFLYTKSTGMVSLDSLLAPSNQGWVITNAKGINDSGQIAADGYSLATNSIIHSLLLTPVPAAVPEASTTVSMGLLLALGLGGLVLAKKRVRSAS